MLQLTSIFLAAALGLGHSSAAVRPPTPSYDRIIHSPANPNITISYKSPDSDICKTAFSKQKQYTGYIHLPPLTLEPYQQNYNINTFFWFFEAREHPETAPLTIWLNGGPGSASTSNIFGGVGPCNLVQKLDGTIGSEPNRWGWDRSSNMLFIDQPTQVGFSYDTPTAKPGGTFSSGLKAHTQNTTMIAASASWHFLQGFLQAFPQYNPGSRPHTRAVDPTDIHLFGISYGGQYGPAFADFFKDQNAKRENGQLPRKTTLEVKLKSLGILNGMVDFFIQGQSYSSFLHNNTYDIQRINKATAGDFLREYSQPGGCGYLTKQCNVSAEAYDPDGEGDHSPTNKACTDARTGCDLLLGLARPGSVYDIRIQGSDLRGSPFARSVLGYLNSERVLKSIGAAVNFDLHNGMVYDVFMDRTGDMFRGSWLDELERLLTLGVRVALVYGDADVICNWVGAESVSLEVARRHPRYRSRFSQAGYAPVEVNGSYVGGDVRQYGNMSFTRIFDAPHAAPWEQSETAFTVFTRIIEGESIATGQQVSLSTFGTRGATHSDHHNERPRTLQYTGDEWNDKIQDGSSVVWDAGQIHAKLSFSSNTTTGSVDHVSLGLPTPASEDAGTKPSSYWVGAYTAPGPMSWTPSSGASSPRSPLKSIWNRVRSVHAPWKKREDRPLWRSAFIIAAAVLGSLLLLSILASLTLCTLLFRSRRKPRQPTPVEPDTDLEKAPEPEVASSVDPGVEPEVPPPAIERHTTRRPSTPMAPIPEQEQPTNTGSGGSPRRLSTHPNEPIDIEEPVGRDVGSRRSTVVPSRKPSEVPGEPTPAPSRKPSDTSTVPPLFVSSRADEPTPVQSRRPSEVPNEPTPIPSRKPSEAQPESTPPQEPTPISSRRPSELPKDPSPIPSRAPSEAPVEPPAPSRRPTEIATEPTSISSRTSSVLPEEAPPKEPEVQPTPEPVARRASTQPMVAEPEPIPRRASTLPPQQPAPVRAESLRPEKPTSLPDEEVTPPEPTVPSRADSLPPATEAAQRKRSVPPTVIEELQNKAVDEDKKAEEAVKEAEERAPTPPPRIATIPPSRAATVKLPSRAPTAPPPSPVKEE